MNDWIKKNDYIVKYVTDLDVMFWFVFIVIWYDIGGEEFKR